MTAQRCVIHRLPLSLRRDRYRQRPRLHAWLRPVPDRPAYYDVLSRVEIEDRTVEELKELAKIDRDVATKHEMTWKTAVTFFHGFLTFHVIPLSIRYSWYRFWKFTRNQFFYPLQKKWTMWDARVDAMLAKLGGSGYQFSLVMVFLRLHGKIGPGRELRYRWGLLRGKDVDHCKAFIERYTLQAEPPVQREDSTYLI